MNLLQPVISVFVILSIIKCNHGNFIEENISLTIDQGTLFGTKSLNYWSQNYFSFTGIPYAKPPIGALRFKAPAPPEPWTGVYDATQIKPICPQALTLEDWDEIISATTEMKQNEDCLFLNVHSKMSKDLKPVMVWIHGGGLEFGSIFEPTYGPELLMTEDIVLVKIAYRLNIFGFISFDDPKYDIPGNAGLKDQVMALKWVQKNIHHFGGDPNQVTIFGESAGGASVHLLYLSPLAKGLFHRAIAQSGSADAPWLTSPNKYPEFAKSLGCNFQDLDAIVNCINGTSTQGVLDAYKILRETDEFNKKLKDGEFIKFNSITIEKVENSNSFLTEEPENIVKQGKFNKVPIMMGFNTHEGEICIGLDFAKPDLTDYRKLIPKDIKIDLESEEAYQLGKKIKEFYYGYQKPSYDLLEPYYDYLTDVLIMIKSSKYAKLQSTSPETAPVYFYHFDYYTKLNYRYNSTSSKKIVTHFDDVRYLFYIKNRTPDNLDLKSKEYIGIHRMIKLWTTFATSKNADPNPVNDPLLNVKWLPVEPNTFNYLKISENLELKQNPVEDRMQFWDEVYGEFYETQDMFCQKEKCL